MSLNACIPPDLSPELKKMLNDSAERWERYHGDRGKGEIAAVQELSAREIERQRQIALSAKAQVAINAAVEKDGVRGLAARMETDARGVGQDTPSAAIQQQVAHTQAVAKMAKFREWASTIMPKDAEAMSANLLRELAGVDTGSAEARAAADSLRQGLDWLKAEFNALGGSIKTRGNYLLPQVWDAAKIKELGRDAFVEKLAAYYETPGIMDPLLGPLGAPLEGDELRAAIADMADGILTGNPRGTLGRVAGAMRNRHLDPRSISFRDVEARIEAAQAFGNPNAFDVVESHLAGMSQEIGVMRVFGPHPALAYSNARDILIGQGVTNFNLLDDTFKTLTGDINAPANNAIAVAGATVRTVMSGGLLPLSLVSQLSDIVPVSLASSLFGIPQMKAIASGLKQVAGAGLSNAELQRIGVVVDGMISHLANSGVADLTGRLRQFSEATHRFYGIKRWAEGMQAGSEAAMMGHLADLSGKSLAEADAAMNGMLGKLGWTEQAWRALREHGIEDIGGGKFASVGALEMSTLDEATRKAVQAQLVYTAKKFGNLAMTIPDTRTRALMNMGGQRGTLLGEGARMATQFKSFGTQFIVNQVGQMLQLQGAVPRAVYGLKVLAGTTALGMVSMQIKRLLKGQELADMTDYRVQLSAVMQGGGFGIMGDFFNTATQQSRFGHGLVTTLAGPAFGAAEDVAALTLGNVGQAARGEQANFTSEAIKLGGKYVPFANAPFLGIAFQRLLVDQARLWADPSGTRRSFMTMEQKQRQEFGSRYWWRPGSTRPEFAR